MNILLLGNGFDLYHHLPTKYINFLNTMKYIKENTPTMGGVTVGSILKEVSKYDDTIRDSYECYSEICNTSKIDDDDLQYIISKLDNCWLNYFLNVLQRDLGWIDFEKEVYKLITLFKAAFITDNGNYDRIIMRKLEDFKLVNNLVDGKYDTVIASGRKRVELDINLIANDLFEEFESFMCLMKLYFKNFVEPLTEKVKDIKLFDLLNCNNNFIVNFNYTNTYEKLYKKDNEKIFHIHGNVDDKIVLGVNPDQCDNIDSIDTSFLSFKKYIQRVIYNTDVDYLEWIKEGLIPADNVYKNYDLLVMGHSLDVTDNDVLEQIFEISRHITILYYNNAALQNQIKNLIGILGKEKFDDYRINKDLKFISQDENFSQYAEIRQKNSKFISVSKW